MGHLRPDIGSLNLEWVLLWCNLNMEPQTWNLHLRIEMTSFRPEPNWLSGRGWAVFGLGWAFLTTGCAFLGLGLTFLASGMGPQFELGPSGLLRAMCAKAWNGPLKLRLDASSPRRLDGSMTLPLRKISVAP